MEILIIDLRANSGERLAGLLYEPLEGIDGGERATGASASARTVTVGRSPSPAATQMFLSTAMVVVGGKGRGPNGGKQARSAPPPLREFISNKEKSETVIRGAPASGGAALAQIQFVSLVDSSAPPP